MFASATPQSIARSENSAWMPVVPLALATGAGAASQHAIGIAVIGGMVMATLGVVFVPVFFVRVLSLFRRRKEASEGTAPRQQSLEGGEA